MPDAMTSPEATREAQRRDACRTLLRQVREVTAGQGVTEASLERIKQLVVALVGRGEVLFPREDFARPEAQGRNHILEIEPKDGYGLYLTIGLPGQEAAPHDHGIWCVNAGISGWEMHRFFRRTDDGSREGHATVEEIRQVEVGPGTGMVMADHDIHATEVIGDAPAVGLALYGYALDRFPSVVWFHPEFSSMRAMPSRRDDPVA